MPNMTFDEVTAACPRCKLPLTEQILTLARKAMVSLKARVLQESPEPTATRMVARTTAAVDEAPAPPDLNAAVRQARQQQTSASPTSTTLVGPVPAPSNDAMNAAVRRRAQEGRR